LPGWRNDIETFCFSSSAINCFCFDISNKLFLYRSNYVTFKQINIISINIIDGFHGVVNGVGGGRENNSIDILVVLVVFVVMVSVATLMSPQIIVQSHIEFFFHCPIFF